MGRTISGMEDDGPIADACTMPSFISSFEEGRVKLSRNLPTETSFTDGKVERSVRDLSRRVTRSNSRLSLDGGEREPEERSSDEEKDARGNNNNNCNGGGGGGGGGERRRASAVEILRRNFGVSKSPSLRLSTSSRMQQHDNHEGTVNSDVTSGYESECGECRKSERETGDAVTENEPTLSDLTSVEFITVTGPRRLRGDSEGSTGTSTEPFPGKEHVYCTVYCIANDSHRNEITDDDTVTSDAPEMDAETGQDASSSPKPQLYTLDDLVDPFGDMAHGLSILQAGGAEATMQSCRVCLEGKSIAPLPCCRKAVCDECLKLYVSSQVRVAKSYISCPIPECSGYLEEVVVISHLANEDVAKYRYFLELSQLDSSTKPCPQCSQFTSLKEHNPNRSEHKYKIQCSNCQFVWCFKCHAPWHNGLKCRDYRKGDKLLRNWASVIEHGQRNAQKCPQCKIHIQRTEGCDHMTCTQCNTNFCYRCGERYRHLRFFGDHTSNLSVFGCKYRYLPDKPHLRRLIRGSVCATKVLIAPVVILLVVVLGALALVIAVCGSDCPLTAAKTSISVCDHSCDDSFVSAGVMSALQETNPHNLVLNNTKEGGLFGKFTWLSLMETRQQGFLDSEPLREADEDFASQVNNSIMTEEEREEIQQELAKLEEEISTLRQVLSSKEKQHADLKQKLGINPLSELRNNFSRGWYDVQTSTAFKKTSETLSTAGQKTTAAFSTLGSAITRKFEDMSYSIRHSMSMPTMRNSPSFKSFEEKVENTVSTIKTKVGSSETGGSFEEVLSSAANASSQDTPTNTLTDSSERPQLTSWSTSGWWKRPEKELMRVLEMICLD
ncbi:putative E3 ubiquitin-protein ligase RNF217 [Larimichthys crocea]|uniref:Uncharacterized protein n=1 Tax=Larimichthys crocea TaxID=215358 RepID=A0ACD3QYL6_LARCR|nr:putative E3 ubiquitin-protein ligase RNF217 [Larimichthys crocea]